MSMSDFISNLIGGKKAELSPEEKEREQLNLAMREGRVFDAAELLCKHDQKDWVNLAKDHHTQVHFNKDGTVDFGLGSPRFSNIVINNEYCKTLEKK